MQSLSLRPQREVSAGKCSFWSQLTLERCLGRHNLTAHSLPAHHSSVQREKGTGLAHRSPCYRGHGAESLLFQEGVDLTHNAHTLSHIWGSAQGPGCHLHQVAWLIHVPITSDTVSRSVTSLLQGEQTPWALPLVLW